MRLHSFLADSQVVWHVRTTGESIAPARQFCTARAPRKPKKPKRTYVPPEPHPLPALRWPCDWFHLWNCLLFGSWREFDWRRLCSFYGIDPVPVPS
jgi:hypothetical protein